MQIVKLSNNKYALRKFTIFGYRYADIDNLSHNMKLSWWSVDDTSWISMFTIEELEQLIEAYNPQLARMKYLEKRKEENEKIKEYNRKRKELRKVQVISGFVKFGCKNK